MSYRSFRTITSQAKSSGTRVVRYLAIGFALIFASFVHPVQAQTATEQTVVTSTPAALNGLIQASDGNFYGASFPDSAQNTTCSGGADCGAIYKITSSGAVSVLYQFSASSGFDPNPPIEGSDGNLYGTTELGGANENGTIYKLTLSGDFTLLYSLTTADGTEVGEGNDGTAEPLVEGSDGNFYGATFSGGSGTGGTIFKITPSGTFSVLYDFAGSGKGPNTPVQGSDGNFYDTTASGTVFKITPTGNLTTLASGAPDPPEGALVEGGDSNFYGMSEYDTMFKVTPTGTITNLYTTPIDNSLITEGLTLGSDGNFYSVITLTQNSTNTSDCCGTIFEITPSGTFTTVYSFKGSTDGSYPAGLLALGSDGKLYGTTTGNFYSEIGAAPSPNIAGTVDSFILSPTLAPPVQLSFNSSQVNSGSPVTLTWKALNAFSTTMQRCVAFVQESTAGAGTWSGAQTGTLSNGVYSGSATITPTAVGTYTYALTCGGQESGFATLTVGNALAVLTTTLPIGTVEKSYSATLMATGGTTPYSWSLTSGKLPDGLSLAASTGIISGTPLQSGMSSLTVQVADTGGSFDTATANLSLSINSGLSIKSTTLPNGTVGAAYSQTITATGGIVPYAWSVASGTLPAGLSLAPDTGVISGTPTTAGTSTFSVKVADAEGTPATATTSESLMIAAAASPGFSTTPANNSILVASGNTGTLALTTTATSGFAGTVNLSCSPSSATFTCSVAPTAVTFSAGGSTTQTSTLTITASVTSSGSSRSTMSAERYGTAQESQLSTYAGLALWLPGSLLGLCGLRRKAYGKRGRKFLAMVLLCVGIVGVTSLMGCGTIQKDINCAEGNSSCSNGTTNTPAGNYTVVVTSTSGTIKSSTTVNVTVQ